MQLPRATRLVVRIAGRRMYLWRAVDHEGEILDMREAGKWARCTVSRRTLLGIDRGHRLIPPLDGHRCSPPRRGVAVRADRQEQYRQ
jgi:DDE domain